MVSGLGRVLHSAEAGPADGARESCGGPGRGSPAHSSNTPTLSSGQPVPRLAPCSRASVSSSHAHRATASSPRRTGQRTSSCMCLSESLPLPRCWLGPCCSFLAVPPERSLGLSPHWLKSVLLAPFSSHRASRGMGGGGLGPDGQGALRPQKPWEPLPESWDPVPASRGLRGLGLSAWREARRWEVV